CTSAPTGTRRCWSRSPGTCAPRLPIHHYAEIDFAGFLEVVDALGGITLCNRSGRRLADAYANLHMAPGCQQMNGVKALARPARAGRWC
ncbi:MAG TPA: LCP family protein, partial [Actinomycetota bacterium]|nr:LCP family protein [Actinomycetota bacterium]